MSNPFNLTRRRVLGGLATIGAASAGAGAGTMALFSDEETNEDNTVSAGTLNLELGGVSSAAITASAVAPGDAVPASPATIDLTNAGSVAGDEIEVGASITGEADDSGSTDDGTNRSANDVARRLFVTQLTISGSGLGGNGLGYGLNKLLTLIDDPGALVFDSNIANDTSTNAGRESHMVRTDDPAEGGRNGVVHVHSNGSATRDYAVSMRSGFALPLENITLAGGSTPVKYDYYGGPNNENSAPDEVYLVVNDGTTDRLVFHAGNDGDPAAETWKTRDVGAEITGDGSPLNDSFFWKEVTSSGVQSLIRPSGGGLDDYFPSGTVIKAIGFGRGNTGGEVVLDTYYDNLVVNNNEREFRPMSLYDMAQRTLDRAPGLNPGQTRTFGIQFEFDRLAGNSFQNDGVEFDLEFTMNQETSQ